MSPLLGSICQSVKEGSDSLRWNETKIIRQDFSEMRKIIKY